MPLSQDVERIFKMRDEFKESQKAQGQPTDHEPNRDQEETVKITELIKKIKE